MVETRLRYRQRLSGGLSQGLDHLAERAVLRWQQRQQRFHLLQATRHAVDLDDSPGPIDQPRAAHQPSHAQPRLAAQQAALPSSAQAATKPTVSADTQPDDHSTSTLSQPTMHAAAAQDASQTLPARRRQTGEPPAPAATTGAQHGTPLTTDKPTAHTSTAPGPAAATATSPLHPTTQPPSSPAMTAGVVGADAGHGGPSAPRAASSTATSQTHIPSGQPDHATAAYLLGRAQAARQRRQVAYQAMARGRATPAANPTSSPTATSLPAVEQTPGRIGGIGPTQQTALQSLTGSPSGSPNPTALDTPHNWSGPAVGSPAHAVHTDSTDTWTVFDQLFATTPVATGPDQQQGSDLAPAELRRLLSQLLLDDALAHGIDLRER